MSATTSPQPSEDNSEGTARSISSSFMNIAFQKQQDRPSPAEEKYRQQNFGFDNGVGGRHSEESTEAKLWSQLERKDDLIERLQGGLDKKVETIERLQTENRALETSNAQLGVTIDNILSDRDEFRVQASARQAEASDREIVYVAQIAELKEMLEKAQAGKKVKKMFKGTSYNVSRQSAKKWSATGPSILGKKGKYLQFHKTEDEAARAYNDYIEALLVDPDVDESTKTELRADLNDIPPAVNAGADAE